MFKKSVSAPIGAILSVMMRWTDRLVGLISTLILARLLTPNDLGIVAMASLVIGMIDVMLDFGVNITLIQKRDVTSDHFNAAWTLRIIQSSLAAIIVYGVADLVAEYFQEPHVAIVMQVLSISLFLVGLENIGIVTFQKNMEFGLEFRLFFVKRIIAFVATIASAWWLRDYWALVIGTLVSRLAGVLLSYIMHPMRPRLSFRVMKDILSFSSWMLLRGIGNYFNNETHRLIVGHRESSSVMGSYSLGGEIAAIPSSEILAPLSRVLLPAFVHAKDNKYELKRMYLLALGIQTLIGIPAGVGLFFVAEDIVLALLGEKWHSAVPFIQLIGAANTLAAISSSGGYLLLALGRVKTTTVCVWLQIFIFLVIVGLFMPEKGSIYIATARIGVAFIGLFLYSAVIYIEMPIISLLDRAKQIWRPILSAFFMGVILYGWPYLYSSSILLNLCLKVLVGFLVYSSVIFALWTVFRRPDGAEQYLLGKLFKNL